MGRQQGRGQVWGVPASRHPHTSVVCSRVAELASRSHFCPAQLSLTPVEKCQEVEGLRIQTHRPSQDSVRSGGWSGTPTPRQALGCSTRLPRPQGCLAPGTQGQPEGQSQPKSTRSVTCSRGSWAPPAMPQWVHPKAEEQGCWLPGGCFPSSWVPQLHLMFCSIRWGIFKLKAQKGPCEGCTLPTHHSHAPWNHLFFGLGPYLMVLRELGCQGRACLANAKAVSYGTPYTGKVPLGP